MGQAVLALFLYLEETSLYENCLGSGESIQLCDNIFSGQFKTKLYGKIYNFYIKKVISKFKNKITML